MGDRDLCWMHNRNERPPAVYLMRLPIGNEVPLCVPCCALWRRDAAADPENLGIQPVWIKELAAARRKARE